MWGVKGAKFNNKHEKSDFVEEVIEQRYLLMKENQLQIKRYVMMK